MIKNYDGNSAGSFEILEEIDPGILGIMHKESKIAYVVDTISKQIHCVHPVHIIDKKGDPWPAWDNHALAWFPGGLVYGPEKGVLISHSRHVDKIFDKYTRWSTERCKCGGECLTARQKIMDVLLKKDLEDKKSIEVLIEDAIDKLNRALELSKKWE